MAFPLLSKKIVKKRLKKFKRPQSDRKISVKVNNQNEILRRFRVHLYTCLSFVCFELGSVRKENDDMYLSPQS